MIRGYPFWSDALAPTTPTIYDPLLRTAVTTLPFRGNSRKQKLMGISVASGTRTLANSVRIKIGNSLPDYRYITIPLNGHQHDVGAEAQVADVNYFDLGGQEILEGEALTISGQGLEGAGGTGAMAGVLYVDDLEPMAPPIPDGNIVCLVHGALAGGGDAGATLTDLTASLDSRNLENNRLYTVFMTVLEPEDQAVEACIFQCGKNTLTVPVGKMVYPRAGLQFSGLEYNAGNVAWWAQCAAAAGMICYMYVIESPIQGGPQPENAPGVQSVQSYHIPGATTVQQLIGGPGSRPTGLTRPLRPSTTMLRR